MSGHSDTERKWNFTRFDHSDSKDPFFRDDLRQIASEQPGSNLPWDPSLYSTVGWPELVALVKQLNAEADPNTQYKIVIMVRRAHKGTHDSTVLDPALDEEGKKQCHELRVKFGRAMHTHHLPPPEVIITSPLTRALQTTQLGITPLFPSVPVIVHESLRERVRGGERNKRHKKEEIATQFRTFNVDCVDKVDPYESFDGEETYEAMWQRVQGALAYVCEKYKEASVVLVVTHCYVMQAIQREITGWDVREEERKDAVEFFLGEAGVYAMVLKGTRTG